MEDRIPALNGNGRHGGRSGEKAPEGDAGHPGQQNPPDFPASLISLPALIEALVERGLVSRHELTEAELKYRQQDRQFIRPQIARPESETRRDESRRETNPHKYRRLRKLMVRYRWSRRLGTWLFGFRWKRVSRDHDGAVRSHPYH